ncbi:MAG TPA: ComF family protein [Verrucomicrobiae bacterium]|nr:ComF family protein [Verrucomicrobiae bacterium]
MSIAAPIRKWTNVALGFVYPEICALCESERASAKDGFVGGRCWQQVRFIRPPFCDRCGLPFEGDITTTFECTNCREMDLHFSSARSAVVAKTVVLEAIHRFKYSRHLWFEPFLADLFLREALPVLRGQKWDFIVPVPLFPMKEREREFNQAERLARHLSGATRIPLNNRLLRRITPTLTQTRLTKQARAQNIRGAFAAGNGAKLDGEKIILVDDVFTTGATTSECARILRKAGAGDVAVWTVARGL